MKEAEAIRQNDWHQGSILLPESLSTDTTFAPSIENLTDDQILIVLSQNCDLIRDAAKEPYVEVLRAIKIEGTPNGNLLYGKNPREIHFQIGELFYAASCHDRARTDRSILAQSKPSEWHLLDPKTVEMITQWIVKRYIRPAFPDNLNKRINAKPNGRKIRKLLDKDGYLFRHLYLQSSQLSEELADDINYQIGIWLVMSFEDYQDGALRELAESSSMKLEVLLSNCPGIEISECSVRHEGQISLDDVHFISPWDWDDLSYKESG